MKSKQKLLIGVVAAIPAAAVVLTTTAALEQSESAHAATEQIARGKYLVAYGDCNGCHTPLKMGPKGPEPDMTRMLSGHPEKAVLPPPPKLTGSPWFAATAGMTAWAGPWGISYAANLTPDLNTGMGIWTEEMFIRAMRDGKHMGYGRPILPPMPWHSIRTLSDGDLKAIFAYLRTVPPVANRVPQPVGPDGNAMNFE